MSAQDDAQAVVEEKANVEEGASSLQQQTNFNDLAIKFDGNKNLIVGLSWEDKEGIVQKDGEHLEIDADFAAVCYNEKGDVMMEETVFFARTKAAGGGIHIPARAKYATLHVPTAAVWNNSPNISAIINNNKLYFSYAGTPYVIPIAGGLYGVADIDSLCSIFFTNQGLPSDLFEISSNDSTQRITIDFNYADIIFDFTQPDTCRDVLGFDSQTFGPFAAPSVQSAPNVAAFNRVVSFFIRSTLLSGGIPQNLSSSGIIADVPISAPVGSLINFEPYRPIKADATELIGNPKQTFEFALLDQLERDVSTMGEEFSLSVVLAYYVEI